MGLFDKIKEKAVGSISGKLLKMAGEGAFGTIVAKIYWALDGHKTEIGIVLSATLVGLQWAQDNGLCAIAQFNCDDYVVHITKIIAWAVAAGFLQAGQVGGALKMAPPQMPLELVEKKGEQVAQVINITKLIEALQTVEEPYTIKNLGGETLTQVDINHGTNPSGKESIPSVTRVTLIFE